MKSIWLLLPLLQTVCGIGVNYATGEMQDHIPNIQGIPLVRTWGVDKLKFFWRDTIQLKYAQDVGIRKVAIAIQNSELDTVASDPNKAFEILQPFQRFDSLIEFIIVGNELDIQLSSKLLPSMRNVQSSIESLGMSAKVTTPFTMGLVGWTKITPPSDTVFEESWVPTLLPVLDFLKTTNSSFMVNIYPYLQWLNHKDLYDLDYALLRPTNSYTDTNTGLTYDSLFDHEFDAIYYALKAEGYSDLPIVVGETGWPTAGREEATILNACIFTNRLIKSATAGTPARPNVLKQFYLFEAFDEKHKPGPDTERDYGIAFESGDPKYPINWTLGADECPTVRRLK